MNKITTIVLTIALHTAASTANGQMVSGELLGDRLIYEIGGASVSSPPTSYASTTTIGADISLGLSNSCGVFKIEDTFEHLISNLERGVDRAMIAIEAAAQAGIAELPFYLLRRADPNLANMLENAMARYEEYYQLSLKSCNQIHQETLAGENPYRAFVKVGDWTLWDNEIENGATATEAAETVSTFQSEQNETGCISWVDGQEAGCKGRPPIKIIEAISVAGYELLGVGGGGGDGGTAPPGSSTIMRIQNYWPNSESYKLWMNQVAGEMQIDGLGNYSATPGQGTLTDLGELTVEHRETLLGLVDQESPIIPEELQASGMVFTPAVIDALKEQDSVTREILIDRMANELATFQTMEKISYARRMSLAGLRDPYIAASGVVTTPVQQQIINELESEYKILRDDWELRTMTANHTAKVVLDDFIRKRTSLNSVPSGRSPTPVIDEGVPVEIENE